MRAAHVGHADHIAVGVVDVALGDLVTVADCGATQAVALLDRFD
jgi:hypothetical protein